MTAYAPLIVVVGFALGLIFALVLALLYRARDSGAEPSQVAIEVKAAILTFRFFVTPRALVLQRLADHTPWEGDPNDTESHSRDLEQRHRSDEQHVDTKF
jgi:hypothetical protein